MLDWQMFGFKLYKYEYFYPFEVVGRGSETQLQVGKNVNYQVLNRKAFPYVLIWQLRQQDFGTHRLNWPG